MMTVAEISKILDDTCAKVNVKVNVPVTINGRLTHTLGRVVFTTPNNKPLKIEFSRKLVETGDHQDIVDVIIHEAAHYVTLVLTGEDHGHDAVFQKMCYRLGTDNCKPKFEGMVRPLQTKYSVICRGCGQVVGAYDRKGKVIKSIEAGTKLYHCVDCGSTDLLVKVN